MIQMYAGRGFYNVYKAETSEVMKAKRTRLKGKRFTASPAGWGASARQAENREERISDERWRGAGRGRK